MKNLVVVQEEVNILKDRAITTSLNVAQVFSKRHDNVLQAIQNLECSPEFIRLNFKVNEYKDSIGRKLPMYEITRDGFAMLAFGFNGKEAFKFKEAYIKKFNAMDKLLQEKSSPEWQQARLDNKATNKVLNDAIQKFVGYAISQGSVNWHTYYNHFANLSNKVVNIQNGKRDLAHARQLIFQTIVNDIIMNTIEESINETLPYKAIYQLCKERVIDITSKTYLRIS